MADKIKKIPFPDFLLRTDYSITLHQEGISEEGEPLSALTSNGKCIFSEKTRRVLDTEGKEILLTGKVIVKGDIAPQLKTVADGTITINGRVFNIHAGYRPRNPDGTIHHTEFEVM